jgi:hypothetical protein
LKDSHLAGTVKFIIIYEPPPPKKSTFLSEIVMENTTYSATLVMTQKMSPTFIPATLFLHSLTGSQTFNQGDQMRL